MLQVRNHTLRPGLAAALCLMLAFASVTIGAAPASAAKQAPWRWARVAQVLIVPAGSTASADLPCPSGYVPISGGMNPQNHLLYKIREYVNPGGNSYTFVIGNRHDTDLSAQPVAWCAHADDVGPITTVSDIFSRNGSGRAGGVVSCPDGFGAIGGGVDWSSFADRIIDYSGPTPLGDAWFATGWSTTAGSILGIDVHCIPNDNLANSQIVSVTTGFLEQSTTSQIATCPSGMRVVTGGSYARASAASGFDNVDRGFSSVSTPSPGTSWWSNAIVKNSVFTTIAICVPVSTPTAAWTQVPPVHSASPTGEFSFSASDAAGENLHISCHTGGSGSTPCSPGTPVPFGPLSDGLRTISVLVQNESGQFTSLSHQFRIDTVAPAVSDMAPTGKVPLTGELTATFSEGVVGVNADTFRIFAGGSSTPVSGSVERQKNGEGLVTAATWTPSAPLIPGQRYTAKLRAAIHDRAGNDLAPAQWTVRAPTTVQNTSAALREYWDPDTAGVAEGGNYISSRAPGSRAVRDITVPLDGEVSLWGIRSPQGGYADIYIDGVKEATASFYAASLRRTRVVRLTDLTPGVHRFEVRVMGTKPQASTGTWVGLDSIDVGTKTGQETSFRQRFRRVVAASASGGSYDVVPHATGGDTGTRPRFELTFPGSAVRLYAEKTPDSGVALIYLDGALVKRVNLNAASTQHDVNVFEKTVTDAVHHLRVVPEGTNSAADSAISIDRVVVN